MAKLINQTKNKTLLTNLVIPESFFQKAKGLIGTKNMDDNFGLWLKPCSAIHTFFMSVDIDVIYLDREMKIKKINHSLKPWKLPSPSFSSTSVIEMKSGTALKNNLSIGDVLYVGP